MRHDEFKKVIQAIDVFTDERNSPRKAESLIDLVNICKSHIESTTHRPSNRGLKIEKEVTPGIDPEAAEELASA